MMWGVPNIWQDGECYILGGGMSLPSMFNVPEHVIQQVITGKQSPSTYSPYMEAIHLKHSIGINQSFRIGNWIDILFFGDNSFYLQNEQDILKFPKLKVTCHAQHRNARRIKYLKKDVKKLGISNNKNTVCWNMNSGAAAISLSANMGCKRIILLGFDMIDVQGAKHWHDLYKPQVNKTKRNIIPKQAKIKSTFDRHLIGFEQIAIDAKNRNIEILNCSNISKITQFRKVELKDL